MNELKIDTTITFQNAWDCKAKIQLHQGSARSGKSYALLQYLIVKALAETLLISVVRKTFPALRTSAIRDFKDIMKGMGLWDDNRWMATEHTYTFDNEVCYIKRKLLYTPHSHTFLEYFFIFLFFLMDKISYKFKSSR
jgi:hypothetical protein